MSNTDIITKDKKNFVTLKNGNERKKHMKIIKNIIFAKL